MSGAVAAAVMRAHPRVCGENMISTKGTARSEGSSPRVRGKPCSRTCRPRRARLIPACAGKTGGRPRRRAGRAAHPRVCGENLYEKYPDSAYSGSSPRVRGKREGACSNLSRAGLIPACAGKTGASSTRGRLCPAHPRVCGENPTVQAGKTVTAGSSPRVRGKQERVHRPLVPPRLIPACAGKTRTTSRTVVWSTAHPRVCGENALVEASPLAPIGSSPRVRGKQRRRENGGSDTGLIPACAGKTCRGSRFSRARTAHPRVCGENALTVPIALLAGGSSPRVRGKPPEAGEAVYAWRLIPACAGKTDGATCSSTPTPAHPRVCGENLQQSQGAVESVGSSPRVRGKLPRLLPGDAPRRLIPACAGKTGALPPGGPPLRAHPRVCGENVTITEPTVGPVGSSPRVRGKLRRVIGVLLPSGAHPRVCGENLPRCSCATSNWGSSPRVRGKLGSGLGAGAGLRLIPACAGKTRPSRR